MFLTAAPSISTVVRQAFRLGVATILLCSLATVVPLSAQVLPPIATISAIDSLAGEPQSSVGTIELPGSIGAFTSGMFRVTLSRAPTTSVTVGYQVSGTATTGQDYVALSGTVTIARGATFADIMISAIDDGTVERDESVIVTLSGGAGYAVPSGAGSTARVWIVDNDELIRLSAPDNAAAEPGGNTGQVVFERLGSLSIRRAVSVQLSGSAANGSDFVRLPDSVVFAPGVGSVTWTITPRPDNDAEGGELLRVQVGGVAQEPSTGVTLTIADATVRVSTSLVSVNETGGASANFIFTRTGDLSAAATVPLVRGGSATLGSDYTGLPTSVTFAAGAPSVTVPVTMIADNAIEGAETIVVTVGSSSNLAPGAPNSATLVIDELGTLLLSDFTISPSSVAGGNSAIGTLTLNEPARGDGVAVSLTLASGAPGLVSFPASVVIPPNQQTATFTITTTAVGSNSSAQLSASIGSATPRTRNLLVSAPTVTALTASQPSVTPGTALDSTAVTVTLTLSSAAPSAGMSFPLTSNNAALVVPSSLTVPGGATSVTRAVSVRPVAASTPVAASVGPGRSASFTILPPVPTAVSFSQASIVGQTDGRTLATATITTSAPAPAAGLPVAVTVTSPLGITSSTATIAGGATSGSVPVTATPVAARTDATLRATVESTAATGAITVQPPSVTAVQVTPDSLIGGSLNRASAQITLNAPAAAGDNVSVSSSATAAFPCNAAGSGLSSVPLVAGQSTVSFSVCTRVVTSATNTEINAGVGRNPRTDALRVLPIPPAVTLALSDSDVPGGANNSLTLTVVLSEPLSESRTFTLSTSDIAAARTQPFVTIPIGGSSAGVPLETFAVQSDRQVTLTATPNAGSALSTATATIMVRAPKVTSVNGPNIIEPGQAGNYIVNLDSPAPAAGLPVQLSSNNTAVTVPSVLTVLRDSTRGRFAATVAAGAASATAALTATTPTSTASLSVAVGGVVRMSALTLSATTLFAGDAATLTVQLDRAAPAGGVTISLSCARPEVQLPASVTVPEGQPSLAVPITIALYSGTPQTTAIMAIQNSPGATQQRSVTVSLQPINAQLQLPVSIASGGSAQGTVSIGRTVNAEFTVTLAAAAPLTVPTSVTILPNASSATFNVSAATVTSNQTVQVNMSRSGITTSRNVTIIVPTIASMTVTPTSISGGSTFVLQLSLNAPAGPNGAVVQLSVPPGSPVTTPPSVTIPPDQPSVTLTLSSSAVTTANTFAITATLGNSTRSVPLTVTP